jgi:hypothetical protein
MLINEHIHELPLADLMLYISKRDPMQGLDKLYQEKNDISSLIITTTYSDL